MQNDFKKNGYVLIKNLLSETEIIHYKKLMQAVSQLDDRNFDFSKAAEHGYAKADGIVKNEAFWPLIYQEKLLSHLNEILVGTPRFLQHSDIHVHYGAVGWHRDNVHRTFKQGPDWDESEEEYAIVRVAIYLQSYAESQFKMGVIPTSHRKQSLLNSLELKLASIYRRLTGRLPPFHLSLKPDWLNIEAGDCLIFDQRLLHTGTEIKGPKYSLYLGYGLDGQHAARHCSYYQNRPDLNYGEIPAKLSQILAEKSLLPAALKKQVHTS